LLPSQQASFWQQQQALLQVVRWLVIAQLTNKRRSRLYSIAEEQKGWVVVVYTGSDLYIFVDLVYGVADCSTR
jgi:hypothetical protein